MANIPTYSSTWALGAKKSGAANYTLLVKASEEFKRISGQIEALKIEMETLIKELDSELIWLGPGAKEMVDSLKTLSQKYNKEGDESSICKDIADISLYLKDEANRALLLGKTLNNS